MQSRIIRSLLLLIPLLVPVSGQRPQSACYSTSAGKAYNISTAYSACSAFQDARNSCNAGEPPRSIFLSCICNQQFLNNIYDCESETSLCLGIEDTQNQFELAVDDWHSSCDTYLRTPLTTPELSALTTTRAGLADPAYCSNAQSSCYVESQLATSCSDEYPAVFSNSVAFAGFASCFCRQSIIQVASVCHYDGNVSCLATPAALSNMFAWNICPAQASLFLHTQSAKATGGLTSLEPIASTSATPRSSGAVPGPSSTNGSDNTVGNDASCVDMERLVLYLATGWLLLFVV